MRIVLWTHAVGGLTENDFILAAKINQLPVQVRHCTCLLSQIQSPIVFNARDAIVVSIVPYSLGVPVLQGWNR